MPSPHDLSTGVTLEAAKLPLLGSTVELFGHVTLVHGYALTTFIGCYALVALRDPPKLGLRALQAYLGQV
jgi:hypothetical protein